jgi:hypothetical protein
MVLFLFSSCQKENVKIPDTGRKLVINGLITTDSLINVRILKSYYFKSEINWDSYSEFDGSEVTLYKNNIFLDSLYFSKHVSANDEIYYKSNYLSKLFYPLSGSEYKIIVKKEGYPDATATTIIPDLVKIEKIDTSRTIVAPGFGHDYLLNCKIEFADPGFQSNYYLINVIKFDSLSGVKSYMSFDCNDPVVEEELGSNEMISEVLKFGYAFSDKLIDGKKYSLNISFNGRYYYYDPYNPVPRNSYVYYIRLYSITEEYFKFIQTLNLFNATYDDPLTEPVSVYSNVSGGYGIFSGAAVSTDSIILHQ